MFAFGRKRKRLESEILKLKATLSTLMPANSGRWVKLLDTTVGAWQRDETLSTDSLLKVSAVFRSIAFIAGDIAKLRLRIMQLSGGIWAETTNAAYSPVLRKPNSFQTRHQFIKYWNVSLLLDGNAYILKRRDQNGVVRRLTVLDPTYITPLVSTSGDVFYQTTETDYLSGIVRRDMFIPASEIIHDTYICFNHPLIGAAPIEVAANNATAASNISAHNKTFFGNKALPGGILTTPDEISDEQASALKTAWQSAFTGDNAGNVAVLEGGLAFQGLVMKSVDAQMLEMLEWTQGDIARAFGVPPWKIGAGTMPSANNVEVQERIYYNSTLQERIEAMESALDAGLALAPTLRTEFDVARGLFRMDALTHSKVLKEQVSGGILAPDEARAEIGRGPAEGGGGATPYLQQQNYSLAALAKRDAKEDPFATSGGGSTGGADSAAPAPSESDELELDEDLAEAVEAGEMTEDEAQDEQAQRIFYAEFRQ